MEEIFSDYFRTERLIPAAVADLGPVGEEFIRRFRAQEFAATGTRLADGGWHISLHKGEWFQAILGLKTALNVTIAPAVGGTKITAGIGIFELQVLPTVIAVFVFAPVILGQIWGIVQQQKLDEEAVRVAEDILTRHAATVSEAAARRAAEEELGPPPD